MVSWIPVCISATCAIKSGDWKKESRSSAPKSCTRCVTFSPLSLNSFCAVPDSPCSASGPFQNLTATLTRRPGTSCVWPERSDLFFLNEGRVGAASDKDMTCPPAFPADIYSRRSACPPPYRGTYTEDAAAETPSCRSEYWQARCRLIACVCRVLRNPGWI